MVISRGDCRNVEAIAASSWGLGIKEVCVFDGVCFFSLACSFLLYILSTLALGDLKDHCCCVGEKPPGTNVWMPLQFSYISQHSSILGWISPTHQKHQSSSQEVYLHPYSYFTTLSFSKHHEKMFNILHNLFLKTGEVYFPCSTKKRILIYFNISMWKPQKVCIFIGVLKKHLWT